METRGYTTLDGVHWKHTGDTGDTKDTARNTRDAGNTRDTGNTRKHYRDHERVRAGMVQLSRKLDPSITILQYTNFAHGFESVVSLHHSGRILGSKWVSIHEDQMRMIAKTFSHHGIHT